MVMKEVQLAESWKVKQIFDPVSLKRFSQYFYKGRRALEVELKSKLAMQLSAYTLLEKDMRNILFWIDQINILKKEMGKEKDIIIPSDRNKANIIKGLYIALLTTYGKCFTSANGRRLNLNKKMVPQEHRELHFHLMHMRHNYAAHKGLDTVENIKAKLVLVPKKRMDVKPKIFMELTQPDSMFPSNSDDLYNLVRSLQSKLIDQSQKIEEKIFKDDIQPKGKEYWYKLAKKS